MKYIVAYDIGDDKKRDEISKLLSYFGRRVQYSLFECELSRSELLYLKRKVSKNLNKDMDRVAFIRVCSSCHDDSHFIGRDIEESFSLIVV